MTPPSTHQQRPLVLIADDNVDIANSLAQLVELMGCDAMAVYDGAQAVCACADRHPDLVILDVNMPRLNGCEAAREIRGAAWIPGCIAAHTALPGGAEPLKSGRNLFNHLLTKPVSFASLQELLDSLPRH